MYLTGLILLTGALVMGGRAAYMLYHMYMAGQIENPIWAPEFWFYTTSYRDGITPEAKQFLLLVGALVIYAIGRHFMNLGDTEDI